MPEGILVQTKIEYQKVIEQIVGQNKLFKGNEDLFEEFCSEIYKRTYLVLPTKNDIKEIIEYVTIISNKVIQDVLVQHERPTELKDEKSEENIVNYVIDRHKYVDETDYDDEEEIRVTNNPYKDYSLVGDPLYPIVRKNLRPKMKKLASAIYEIHMQMPEKLYFQIFYYKYCKGLEQAEVAKKTGISQGELSRRLLSLIQIIKAYNIKLD